MLEGAAQSLAEYIRSDYAAVFQGHAEGMLEALGIMEGVPDMETEDGVFSGGVEEWYFDCMQRADEINAEMAAKEAERKAAHYETAGMIRDGKVTVTAVCSDGCTNTVTFDVPEGSNTVSFEVES